MNGSGRPLLSGRRLLIAGGGTGGHLFPALAVGDAWEAGGGEVLYVGTNRGLEHRLLPKLGKPLARLRVGPIQGNTALGRLGTLLGLPVALLEAVAILRRYRPHAILGMGGYISAPAVVAGRLLRVPTVLHEQNARAGLANRLLGRVVLRVLISFPEAEAGFPADRVRLTGNPVAKAFRDPDLSGEMPQGDRPFRLLVFGGSQGAKVFAEVVPPALVQMKHRGMLFQVRHQVRGEDLGRVQELYRQAGIDARVEVFIEDMVAAYREADLVICRSGATTVSELAVMGKPALLVPYPFAAEDHQVANARALTGIDAAWMQRQGGLTRSWLLEFLEARMADSEGLRERGLKARSVAKQGAAEAVVDNILELVVPDGSGMV